MIEKQVYPMTDNRGLFLKSRYPLNFDKIKNEWLMPGQCINISVPEKIKGMVAVLNSAKTGWIYEEDNSGVWYSKETKKKHITKDPLFNSEDYIREEISEYEDYISDTLVFNLVKYKDNKIEELSSNCKTKRMEILSDQTITNIVLGATLGYPEYLTPGNITKLIEIFKDIYHTYSTQILAANNQATVDVVVDSIAYPTTEYIITQLVTIVEPVE